jgi:hypothetical protein
MAFNRQWMVKQIAYIFKSFWKKSFSQHGRQRKIIRDSIVSLVLKMYGGIFMNGVLAFFECNARQDYGYRMLRILNECSHSITWNECHVQESVLGGLGCGG